MRKSLYRISGVIVGAALLWWAWSRLPIARYDYYEFEPPSAQFATLETADLRESPEAPPKVDSAAFAHLPVGGARTVDFNLDEATRSRLTPREQADQLRDWLLFTVVSDAGLSADEVNRVLYDVPTIRHGHMRPMANFEYGKVRSCSIGNDRVVAIIPRTQDEAERRELLGHIGDEHRKNRGQNPGTLLVFEYDLDPARLLGSLTRLKDVDGADLFTKAYGYEEQPVTSRDELDRFLHQVDDVTSARFGSSGLVLGGRKLRNYRGIRVEDVAAIWQAQRKLKSAYDVAEGRFKSERDNLRNKWQAVLDDLNNRQRLGLDLPGAAPNPAMPTNPGFSAMLRALGQDQPAAPRPDDFSGFSRPFPGISPPPPTFDQPAIPKPDDFSAFTRPFPGVPPAPPSFDQPTFPKPDDFSAFTRPFPGVPPAPPSFGQPAIPRPDDFSGFSRTIPGIPPANPAFDQPAATTFGPTYRTASDVQAAYDREAEELLRRQAAEARSLHLKDTTGFSLDPDYDYAGIQAWLAGDAGAQLRKVASLSGAPIADAEVDAVQRSLAAEGGDNRIVPLLKLFDKVKHGGSSPLFRLVAEGMEETLRNSYQFQAARYDGELQGTEIGMVLFYTDLLAKLWVSVDYSAPRDVIADFRTGPDGCVPPLFKAETITQPNTRLWFGPEDRAYQLMTDRQGVLLARCATRIYAASSDPLRPGVEVPPTYQADRRMGWWNDHFEEVADYEQEYERLNEYIKWSIVIGWLEAQDAMGRLDFLGDLSVDHSAWFPEWVSRHPELRFKQWERVPFFERGAKNTQTEALPILVSRPFANFGEKDEVWTISGGVSAARPSELKARPFLPAKLEGATGLSLRGVDLKTLDSGGGKLTTLRGTTHVFEMSSPAQATMKVTPRSDAALRSTHGDLASTEFHRSVTRSGGELRLDTTSGFGELGELRIAARGNGFKTSYASRDIDAGQAIARDLSRSADPRAFLAADPRVGAAVELREGGWLIKQHGSAKWVKVVADRAPTPEIGAGWNSRVADTSLGATSYDVAWIEPGKLQAELGASEYLRIGLESPADKRPTIQLVARGPPEGARPIAVSGGPAEFAAAFDPSTRSVYLRAADLPRDLAASPESLTNLFRGAQPAADGSLRLSGRSALPPAEAPPLIACLESGNKIEAARLLAQDPEGSRLLLEKDLSARLRPIDDLLEQNRPGEALELATQGLRVHPERPELLLRLGEAHIARGRPEDAALLDFAAGGDRRVLHDEINRLLKQPDVKPSQREYLRAVRGDSTAHDLQAQQKTQCVVKRAVAGDTVTLEATYAGLPPMEPAQAGAVTPADALYADDSLGLNNLDWSPGARQQTLSQALQSPGVELYVVTEPDPVLQQRPGRVVIQTQRLTNHSTYSRLSGGSGGGSGAPDDDDDDDPDRPPGAPGKSHRTYLLRVQGRFNGLGSPLRR
jgi:hypothetical protein